MPSGIYKRNMNWSQSDIEKLKELYKTKTAKEVSEILGRSPLAVKSKIDALRLKKTKEQKRQVYKKVAAERETLFNEDEIETVVNLYKRFTVPEIAGMLGKSRSAVKSLISRLKVTLPAEEAKTRRKKSNPGLWSKEEEEFLIRNFTKMTVREIAEKLNRSKFSVKGKVTQLRLKLPEETRLERKRIGQFKKGMKPVFRHPKGFSFYPQNEYKKGNIPHNTKYDGAISIRTMTSKGRRYKYKWIRISKGVWKLLHKHLWEKENGPVPEGHCIWFKDGDRLNAKIENLELITMEESAKRNRASDGMIASYITSGNRKMSEEILKKYPELIELKRKQLELRKEANERSN